MEMNENIRENLSRAALASGLSFENMEKEFRLMDFMRRLFSELERRGSKAALFGGTALNKGYFLERQRFSKDLDIDGNEKEIASALEAFSREFHITRLNLRPESPFENWRLRYGPHPWEELLVDVGRRKPPPRAPLRKVEMHSLLEYHGYLVSPVPVPSYSLEFLLARKLVALNRRVMGKDMYDSYFGLKLNPDRAELAKWLRILVKSEFQEGLEEFISSTIYWVKKADAKSESFQELLSSVPMPYRRSAAEMQNTIIFELEKLME